MSLTRSFGCKCNTPDKGQDAGSDPSSRVFRGLSARAVTCGCAVRRAEAGHLKLAGNQVNDFDAKQGCKDDERATGVEHSVATRIAEEEQEVNAGHGEGEDA